MADLLIVVENPLDNISNISTVIMVFKDGTSVDLNRIATYWDYFSTSELKKGFVKEAENVAGFQRGKTEKE